MGVDAVVSGLIAVLFVCHEMHAFARPGANEKLAKWMHRIFCHIKGIKDSNGHTVIQQQ